MLVGRRCDPEHYHVAVPLTGSGIGGIGTGITEEHEGLGPDLVDRVPTTSVLNRDVGHTQRQFVNILDPGPPPSYRHDASVGLASILTAVEVRRVHADEHDRAGRLVVAAYCALPGGRVGEGYGAALADVKSRAAEAEVLVALDNETLLGCVTFVPDAANRWAEQLEEGEASIRMLGVDPASQGRGAGSALVSVCIDRARATGRRAVFLHSTPSMTAAHRLYLRAGFIRLPERDWLPVPEVQLLAFGLAL